MLSVRLCGIRLGMGKELRPVLWDTNRESEVSVSLDIGVIPVGYPGAGRFIITIQAHPIDTRANAERIAAAMREAIGSRLGITLERQEGVG